jgi:hypothetical protein
LGVWGCKREGPALQAEALAEAWGGFLSRRKINNNDKVSYTIS